MKWVVNRVLPYNVATCWQAKNKAAELYEGRPTYIVPAQTREWSKDEKTIWHIWCDELNEHTVLAPTCVSDRVDGKYNIPQKQREQSRERYERWNSWDVEWSNSIDYWK